MFVSVVLPCYNGAATLAVMLDSLVAQTFRGPWELLFVDNGSLDSSVQIAQSYEGRLPIRVVRAYSGSGHHGNVGHSYTVGFRAAKGDVILVCEADDECDRDWMAHMVKALETCDFAVPALEYERLNPPCMTWGKDRGLQSRSAGLPVLGGPLKLPYAVCNAIGMTRHCYERVGDPTDWLGPPWDVDYCWRVQLAGMKLTFVPEAIVHYRLKDTARSRFNQARAWGRGQVNLHVRYGMSPWWRYLAYCLVHLMKAGAFLVMGPLLSTRPYAYWAFDWGFVRGQLDAFPKLFAAQLKKMAPDANVLSGKHPEGPQTFAVIPDA